MKKIKVKVSNRVITLNDTLTVTLKLNDPAANVYYGAHYAVRPSNPTDGDHIPKILFHRKSVALSQLQPTFQFKPITDGATANKDVAGHYIITLVLWDKNDIPPSSPIDLNNVKVVKIPFRVTG